MANIRKIKVGDAEYNINLLSTTNLSVASLNVTGTIKGANLNLGSGTGTITAGTANLRVINVETISCYSTITCRDLECGQVSAPAVVTTTLLKKTDTYYYKMSLPSKNGTLALTSDIPERTGSSSLSYATFTPPSGTGVLFTSTPCIELTTSGAVYHRSNFFPSSSTVAIIYTVTSTHSHSL